MRRLDSKTARQFIAEKRKEAFEYDVNGLTPYTDEQSEDFIATLVDSANILPLLPVMEGVKSGEKIKLIDSTLALQEIEGCDLADDDGGIIFSDKTLNTVKLGSKATFCNETLVGTWAQMLLDLGLREQNDDLVIEDVILAHLNQRSARSLQNIVLFGDVDGQNPNLIHFNGHVKNIFNDALVPTVAVGTGTTAGEIAYNTAENFATGRSLLVRENNIGFEIWTTWANLDAIKKHLFDTKDYNALTMQVTETETEYSLILPVSGVRVRAISGMESAVTPWLGVIPRFMFVGTDATSDTDGLTKVPYLHNKVSYEIRYRAGVQHVLPQYFLKLATVS
jgi:hypothetical protein